MAWEGVDVRGSSTSIHSRSSPGRGVDDGRRLSALGKEDGEGDDRRVDQRRKLHHGGSSSWWAVGLGGEDKVKAGDDDGTGAAEECVGAFICWLTTRHHHPFALAPSKQVCAA